MLNDSSSPTVTHCTFLGNTAALYGGGMCNIHSSVTVNDCVFSANSTIQEQSRGGGMYNYESAPVVSNCTFTNTSNHKCSRVAKSRSVHSTSRRL